MFGSACVSSAIIEQFIVRATMQSFSAYPTVSGLHIVSPSMNAFFGSPVIHGFCFCLVPCTMRCVMPRVWHLLSDTFACHAHPSVPQSTLQPAHDRIPVSGHTLSISATTSTGFLGVASTGSTCFHRSQSCRGCGAYFRLLRSVCADNELHLFVPDLHDGSACLLPFQEFSHAYLFSAGAGWLGVFPPALIRCSESTCHQSMCS